MNRQTKRRIIALLVCVLFIAVSFLSISFELGHTEHDCTGNDCTVCAQLHATGNLLRQLAAAVVGAAFIYTNFLFGWTLLQNTTTPIVLLTPISLKVRMNN